MHGSNKTYKKGFVEKAMKHVFLCVMFFSLSIICWGDTIPTKQPPTTAAKPQFDFRKVKWGMTKSQVKKSEVAMPSKEEKGLLRYLGEVAGLKCLIDYSFVADTLCMAGYIFINKHANKTLYINDYETLKEILIEKYGTPSTDRTVWYDDLYRDDPEDWGLAVSIGHLAYVSQWETNPTNVSLGLIGDNFDITLGVTYDSNKYRYLREKTKKLQDTQDF